MINSAILIKNNVTYEYIYIEYEFMWYYNIWMMQIVKNQM